ncbi:hypothetical protein MTO96_031210 [Rhipicephalus appendiculatus]
MAVRQSTTQSTVTTGGTAELSAGDKSTAGTKRALKVGSARKLRSPCSALFSPRAREDGKRKQRKREQRRGETANQGGLPQRREARRRRSVMHARLPAPREKRRRVSGPPGHSRGDEPPPRPLHQLYGRLSRNKSRTGSHHDGPPPRMLPGEDSLAFR